MQHQPGPPPWAIHVGDCRQLLATMPEASVDAIVTDPPYELAFMGRAWDASGVAFDPATWQACLRVLKPGGHLLAFGATRTSHRIACAIEDAGFEIRDTLAWLYGSGFPKSLDVSKAIDNAAGAQREVVGMGAAVCEHLARGERCPGHGDDNGRYGETVHAPRTAPATAEAREWQGWGTALKPAFEPIILARKPLAGTVAANVLAHGTGALNIDATRIATSDSYSYPNGPGGNTFTVGGGVDGTRDEPVESSPLGRWPANVLLDHDAAAMLDRQTGELHSQDPATRNSGRKPGWSPSGTDRPMLDKSNPNGGDTGGASRFFYVAKASRTERNAGLDDFEPRKPHHDEPNGRAWDIPGSHSTARANHHPTVKPVDLMRYLIRLVTPQGGHIIDPFTGSGTTGIAAILEGARFTGIELSDEYAAIARARITYWHEHGDQALALVAAERAAERARDQHTTSGQLDLTTEATA